MAGRRDLHDGDPVLTNRPQLHTATIGSQTVEIPIVPVADDAAVALLLTSDVPMSFLETAASELAERLASSDPDAIVATSAAGTPVGVAVAAAMGHDQCAVLHKSAKFHLGGALTERVGPTSAGGAHLLRLDVLRLWLIEGRRVAFVDDVMATGSSAAAAVRLIRRAGGEVAAIGVLATGGSRWLDALGDDARLVKSLGSLPPFGPDPEQGWVAGPTEVPAQLRPALTARLRTPVA